jgi:hypothetical protein
VVQLLQGDGTAGPQPGRPVRLPRREAGPGLGLGPLRARLSQRGVAGLAQRTQGLFFGANLLAQCLDPGGQGRDAGQLLLPRPLFGFRVELDEDLSCLDGPADGQVGAEHAAGDGGGDSVDRPLGLQAGPFGDLVHADPGEQGPRQPGTEDGNAGQLHDPAAGAIRFQGPERARERGRHGNVLPS